MRIYAGCPFKHAGMYSDEALKKATEFFEQAVQLDPNFAVAWAQLSRANSYKYSRNDFTALTSNAAKRALDNAQKLEPDSPETLLALGYYQRFVVNDYGAAKTTFQRVSEMLPGSSEVPFALGRVARNQGHWDESKAYYDRALSLDPRNVELLVHVAWYYTMLRQFPRALKFYDRALDIIPNDRDLMGAKASVYQAQGNLKEAANILSQIDPQTSYNTFNPKIAQLRLERNYREAIHLLQTRLTQFHFLSNLEKGEVQSMLAFLQYVAGDSAGASLTAKQARNTLEAQSLWATVALIYAVTGEKDSALKAAERDVMLGPSAKDAVNGPGHEENLALIETIVGENSRAISILTKLLQTPYNSWLYSGVTPITPALLRLDPFWDPLRSDPAFQKLCEEKIDKSIAVQKAATR